MVIDNWKMCMYGAEEARWTSKLSGLKENSYNDLPFPKVDVHFSVISNATSRRARSLMMKVDLRD